METWELDKKIKEGESNNLLGTPDTNLRGRKTLIARSVRRSTPSSFFTPDSSKEDSGSSGVKIVMYLEHKKGVGRKKRKKHTYIHVDGIGW